MSTLLLVRHGQAHSGLRTYDRLSPLGRTQAARLGDVLRERGVVPDRVLCGGLRRQRETAELMAERLGIGTVLVDPRWREYEHGPLLARAAAHRRWHGLLVAELVASRRPRATFERLLSEALASWVRWPEAEAVRAGAEPFSAFLGRTSAALEDAASEPGLSVVVSSAGAICGAIAPLVGLGAPGWLSLQRAAVNTGVSKVIRGRRGITLVSFNEHGHLEGAPGVSVSYR